MTCLRLVIQAMGYFLGVQNFINRHVQGEQHPVLVCCVNLSY